MTTPTEPQIITIDGKNYNLHDLPQEAHSILQVMKRAQERITSAQEELMFANLAFNQLGVQLNEQIEGVKPVAPPKVVTRRRPPAKKKASPRKK